MRITEFYTLIKSDISFIAGTSFLKIFLGLCFSMQLRLILNYRLGNYLHQNRNYFFTIIINYLKKRQISCYGCDISYFSKIGKHIRFPHPLGIVIGNNCLVGNNVTIWQNVTIGSSENEVKKYPKVEDGVKIFTNSVIIGNIVIGQNSIIGAMSFINKSVKSNSVSYGK